MACGSCGTFLQVICDVTIVVTPQNSSKTRKIHAQKYKKDTKPQEPGECITHDSGIVQVCALGMLTNTNNSQRQPTKLCSRTCIICEPDALHRDVMPPPIIYARIFRKTLSCSDPLPGELRADSTSCCLGAPPAPAGLVLVYTVIYK